MKQKLRVIRSPFTAVHIHVRILRSNSVRSVLIEFQFARARACVCVHRVAVACKPMVGRTRSALFRPFRNAGIKARLYRSVM